MALCSVQNVYDTARAHIGDTATLGGQQYTNTFLKPHYVAAVNEFYRVLRMDQSTRDRHDAYYDVQPFTTVLTPSIAGIADLGNIENVSERGSISELTVNSVVQQPTYCSISTTTPHGFASGQQVVQWGIQGISDNVNGLFAIDVTSSTAWQIWGLLTSGAYTAGTGTISTSAEAFTQVLPQSRLDITTIRSPQTILGNYAFEDNVFWFPPCSKLRQIKVTYLRSGNPPTTTTQLIPVDDCLDILALRTAGLALRSSGNVAKGNSMTIAAVGDSWEGKGIAGGLLIQFILNNVRELQALPPSQRRTQPWRVHPRRRGRIW